jgi:hypothetical protein
MSEHESFIPDPQDIQAKLDQAELERTAAESDRTRAERLKGLADGVEDNAGGRQQAGADRKSVAGEYRGFAAQHEGAAYVLQAKAETMQKEHDNAVQAIEKERTDLEEHWVDVDVAREPTNDVQRGEDGYPLRDSA